MQRIVKYYSGFHYVKFQPGDGTIYTALVGQMPEDDDNIYLALGPAMYIEGGYFFRRSSLFQLAEEMHKAVKEGRQPQSFIREYHYTQYQQSHFGMRDVNEWTVIVAILLALVFAFGSLAIDEDIMLVEYVYRNQSDKVLESLETLFAEYDLASWLSV